MGYDGRFSIKHGYRNNFVTAQFRAVRQEVRPPRAEQPLPGLENRETRCAWLGFISWRSTTQPVCGGTFQPSRQVLLRACLKYLVQEQQASCFLL